jgi:hypothetical protein
LELENYIWSLKCAFGVELLELVHVVASPCGVQCCLICLMFCICSIVHVHAYLMCDACMEYNTWTSQGRTKVVVFVISFVPLFPSSNKSLNSITTLVFLYLLSSSSNYYCFGHFFFFFSSKSSSSTTTLVLLSPLLKLKFELLLLQSFSFLSSNLNPSYSNPFFFLFSFVLLNPLLPWSFSHLLPLSCCHPGASLFALLFSSCCSSPSLFSYPWAWVIATLIFPFLSFFQSWVTSYLNPFLQARTQVVAYFSPSQFSLEMKLLLALVFISLFKILLL